MYRERPVLPHVVAWRSVVPLAEAADPMGALAGARAGLPVCAIADSCGLSMRQPQRRTRTTFRYATRMLIRIMRLQRAVALARGGSPFAGVPLGELVR
jgi:hypothetical protein